MKLTYDRQITISTGGSCKATYWPPATLLVSEMWEKLSIPERSTETVEEYHAMPKARRDALKDRGGFVGGELLGNRRKAACVTGRDLLTLDMDNISANSTDEALRRLDGLQCAYCVYSTRSHRPEAPRLRVLFPVDRAASPDEYEPLMRMQAKRAGLLDWCDPSSFRVHQLMYNPSVCADGEYIFRYADKPFASVDGTLALYADWRDVSSWPQIEGVPLAKARPSTKQEDPTKKEGVIGAFCRLYDVHRAIAELIRVYEPVDNAGDRYTFTGGSTAGGAVVYDNGLFLFSHHATDPCSGMLVNAFDLVRLHAFGSLDDDVKENTPVGKYPSYTEMRRFALSLPDVAELFHQERGDVILEAFGTPVSENGQLSRFIGGLDKQIFTTVLLRNALTALGISIKNNVINHKTEIAGYPVSWSGEQAENNLHAHLLDILKPAGVKGATKNAICDSLDIIADENRFNPVIDMLQSRKWDGYDRVREVIQILGLEYNSLPSVLYYKGLWQSVAMAHNSLQNPFGADGVPVLQGPQGVGKTSAIRELVPLSLRALFKDGVIIDPRNKDTIIQATSGWIGELGELDGITKRDQQGLKAFITSETDKYRTPYARKEITLPRRTAFWGTVNPSDYLTDTTGNRRFWTIPIEAIDLERLFHLSEEWKLQLWAQMYAVFCSNPQGYRLMPDERCMLESANQKYTKPVKYELEIRELFNYDLPANQWGRFTSGDIAGKLWPRDAPLHLIGKALSAIAKRDERVFVSKNGDRNLYTLPLTKLPYDAHPH